MATFKEALTTSLTNFAKSIAKTYPKTANIVDNLLSTDSTLPLSAKQGNVLQTQIDELNSNMPIFIKDKHTVSLDTTCDEALYTLYTAEKPCFVSFSSMLFWIHACPTELTFQVNTRDNLYSAKVFTSKDRLANHIHLSGCVYLNTGEELKVFATGSQTAEDDIYSTLMINYV